MEQSGDHILHSTVTNKPSRAHFTPRVRFAMAASNLGDPSVFKYAFVMAKGDFNLETIFRQERPSISISRNLMKEVGLCLQHIHSKSVLHGDLKMLNVVRFQEKLRLIDMDSATIMGDERDVQVFGGEIGRGTK